MDSDGLPIVGSGIDYTKVGALNQKRTLAFLNHFVTHTVQFLNKFSTVCEAKLSNMSIRIQRLETTMSILETKLSSIPGLENVVGNVTPSAAVATTETAPSAGHEVAQAMETPEQSGKQQEAENAEAVADVANQLSVESDPRFAKYFKMLRVGVPEQVVKNKMALEGLDPLLIDDPSAPAPPQTTTQDSDEDDFSDDSSGFSD